MQNKYIKNFVEHTKIDENLNTEDTLQKTHIVYNAEGDVVPRPKYHQYDIQGEGLLDFVMDYNYYTNLLILEIENLKEELNKNN